MFLGFFFLSEKNSRAFIFFFRRFYSGLSQLSKDCRFDGRGGFGYLWALMVASMCRGSCQKGV